MVEPVQPLPEPGTPKTAQEFVDRMVGLRLWAGQPSLRTLRRLAGTTTAASGAVVDALPTSTTSYLLNGRGLPRPPRLEFVESFVAACLAACEHPDPAPVVERWREAWRALSAPPAPAPPPVDVPPGDVAAQRPRLPRSRVALAVVGVLGVCAAVVVAVLDWGRPSRADNAVRAVPSMSGLVAHEVRRGAVAVMRDQQGIDFDRGVVTDQRAAGVDLTPWGVGNHLTTKSDALLALLDGPGPERYEECASLPTRARIMAVNGLYDLAAGHRICVWTRDGAVAMAVLDEKPTQKRGGVVFHYVVWQPDR